MQHDEFVPSQLARYRMMADYIPQLTCFADAAGNVVECNQRWYAYTGQTADDARGHGWMRVLHMDDVLPLSAKLRQAVANGTIAETEYRLRRACDGSFRWHLAHVVPVRDDSGALTAWIGSATDITRLHDLQQRQEDLLHLVSHDLILPLTVIHGHMEQLEEALRSHGISDELAMSSSTIDRNVQRMQVMIKDLVEMARLEGRQFALTREAVLLQMYLPDLVGRLRQVLPMQRVTIGIPADLPAAHADYSRLERILLNFLSNAFKYSAPETPVHIQAERQGEEIVIAVRDEGRGIAMKDLPHLFERFYRADSQRQAEGIGLGLYISKLLVEAHGGRIWAESEVNRGSAFMFTLPVFTGE